MYAFLLSSIRALCPVPHHSQFSPVYLPYNTQYKWWSSSLCGFLQPLITHSYVQYRPQHPALDHPRLLLEPLVWEIKCHSSIQQQAELYCLCFKFYFLRSWQLLIDSNNIPRFEELQSSLSCRHIVGPSHVSLSWDSKFQYNILFTCTPVSSNNSKELQNRDAVSAA
jgi:hypothetical protein